MPIDALGPGLARWILQAEGTRFSFGRTRNANRLGFPGSSCPEQRMREIEVKIKKIRLLAINGLVCMILQQIF